MIAQKHGASSEQLIATARAELEKRRRQGKICPGIFSSNPALTMMLELYVAEAEKARSQTIYLIEAAGLSRGTGVRWLHHMNELGLVRRMISENDHRSKFVELTKAGRSTMEDYLIECREVDSCK